MPELPEVETVRRGMATCLPGRTLREVTLRRPDLRWPIPVRAVQRLRGERVEAVERRAKYLLVPFSGTRAPVAMIHLGMSGRLWIDAVRPRSVRPEWELHEHWRMDFGDRLVRYEDARRFGMLDVVASRQLGEHRLLRDLGPEPLDEAFDAEEAFRRTRGRKVSVKGWLMSAANVVGVGNIYASEICFRAGVRPSRRVYRTTRNEWQRLVTCTRAVLGEAIQQGGTTLRDYIGVDRRSGYFQQSLAVYGRAGEPCTTCGAAIALLTQQNRSSYYCPSCQR